MVRRYSPHRNLVERIRDVLKAYPANSPTLTIAGRMRQVHAFFRYRTCDQMSRTAAQLTVATCQLPTTLSAG